MSPTLLSPDRQDIWAPSWLVELDATAGVTPLLFASLDLETSSNFYHGRLLGDIVVSRSFVDTFWGWTEVANVSVRLANADGGINSHYTTDLRGKTITVKRYDRKSGTTVTEFTGIIQSVVRGAGLIEFEAAAPDLSVFEQEIPKGVVNEAFGLYPVNVGKTLPVIFGNVGRVPLLYVNDNTGLLNFDYLVSRGSVTVTTVYRTGVVQGSTYIVNPSEYTVSTILYPGFTVVRFTARQIDFQNQLKTLFADVTGFSAERNFARAIKTLLSDTTYGLGQPVNAASFNQAEADLNSVGNLFCDGAMLEPQQAQDLIQDLLYVRGMRLSMNASGEWTIVVDKEQANIRLAVQDGTGDGEKNLLRIGERRRPALADAIKTLALKYKYDEVERSYRLLVARTVNSAFGSDQIREHRFIRDSTTADKVVHYLSQREKLGAETVDVEITQEARQLTEGELVTLTHTPLGYSGETLEVRRIEKRTDRIVALLGGWDAAFYTYAAGSLPGDSTPPTLAELAVDIPAVPTGLAMASVVTQTSDGSLEVAMDFSWNANSEVDLKEYEIQYRRQGDTNFTPRLAQAGTTTFREIGVLGATAYEAKIRAIDIFGNESAFSSLVAHTTVADTTAPGAPTGLTATARPGFIELDWDDNTEKDLSEYGVWRNTTDTPGTAVKIAEVRASRFLDSVIVAGNIYYYWISAFDNSENQSAKSLVASATAQGSSTSDAPSNPSAATKSAEGVYQGSDGATRAYFDIALPAMPSGAAYMNMLAKLSAASQYEIVGQVTAGSVTLRADDLTPGQSYNIAVQAFSGGGGASSIVQATSSPFTAPGDTTAPAAPTSVVVTPGFQANILSWTNSTASDLSLIEVWRSTSNDSSTATKIGESKTNYFVNDKLANATTYYYWLKSKDLTGNTSGFHAGQYSGAAGTTLRAATDDAQADAWTQMASVKNDGSVVISGTSEANVDTLVVTTNGGDVYLLCQVDATIDGDAAGNTLTVRMKRDSTELYGTSHDLYMPAGSAAVNKRVPMVEIDTPASGTYTYKITGQNVSSNGITTFTKRRLIILVRKK